MIKNSFYSLLYVYLFGLLQLDDIKKIIDLIGDYITY